MSCLCLYSWFEVSVYTSCNNNTRAVLSNIIVTVTSRYYHLDQKQCSSFRYEMSLVQTRAIQKHLAKKHFSLTECLKKSQRLKQFQKRRRHNVLLQEHFRPNCTTFYTPHSAISYSKIGITIKFSKKSLSYYQYW